MRRYLPIALGPAVTAVILLSPIAGLEWPARATLGITAWMAIWWVTEAIPISATALLPLCLFPFLGVMSAQETSISYGHEVLFLFLGGMLIAQAMERCNLHRRIALSVIRVTGTTSRSLILGFMIATAVVSMWVSNTATTVMVLPVALATLKTLTPNNDAPANDPQAEMYRGRFAKALLLGVAYSANIGGMGTLVGTAPNVVFIGVASKLFPGAPEISFFDWMKVGVPMVVIFVPIMWFLLTRVIWKWDEKVLDLDRSHIKQAIRDLGPLRRTEKMVLTVFMLTAFLWIFRADLRLGIFTIPGWSNLFGNPEFLRDSTVAMAAALTLFLLPANLKRREFLLGSDWFRHVPWSVLILLGGGFALATGFSESGLSVWLAERLGGLGAIPLFFMVTVVVASVSFFTEVASNTATTTVLLPILAATGIALGLHPFLLMLPCTLAASCAFMLPAATPPNAIIFSSGHLHVRDMLRSGIAIDVAAILVIVLLSFTVLPWALGFTPSSFPAWAH